MTPPLISLKARKRGESLADFLTSKQWGLRTMAELQEYLALRDCRHYRIVEHVGLGIVEFHLPRTKSRIIQDVAAYRPLAIIWTREILPWWHLGRRIKRRSHNIVK